MWGAVKAYRGALIRIDKTMMGIEGKISTEKMMISIGEDDQQGEARSNECWWLWPTSRPSAAGASRADLSLVPTTPTSTTNLPTKIRFRPNHHNHQLQYNNYAVPPPPATVAMHIAYNTVPVPPRPGIAELQYIIVSMNFVRKCQIRTFVL